MRPTTAAGPVARSTEGSNIGCSREPPHRKQLLKLCNDGYGASSVGEDAVTVGTNHLIHRQTGGSSSRWDSTVTFTLSPWRAVTERACGYSNLSADDGSVMDIDFRTMSARSIAKDSASKWGDNVGCPRWPAGASEHFTSGPAPDLFGGYNIIVPILAENADERKIPAGTAIGDCAHVMTTAGANGFVVFGQPAPPGHAAELRVIAETPNTLLVQVYDPMADTPTPANGSWINLPHVEIWLAMNLELVGTRPPIGDLAQIAVDLNGKVYAGVGRQDAMPSVERWPAHDAAGHPVAVLRLTWPNDYQLLNGTAIVYSQAKAGRQARLVATTGIVKNHPLYIPALVSLPNGNVEPRPGGCHIRDGRLSMDVGVASQ